MSEPFMTADFPERLALVRRYGVPCSRVVTNGTLLTERVIEKILDAQITTLAFSIDGGTKEIYEDIRTGARFETVLGAIASFRRLREKRGTPLPKLQISHVLMRRNVGHFEEFIALLDSIRPEQVDVRTVLPMTHTSGQESTDPHFFEQVRRARPLLEEWCERTGAEDSGFIRDRHGVIDLLDASGARMTCRRPWDTLAIQANGDVHPCMSWTRPPVGNLARQSFGEIWNGEERARLRAEFENAKPGVDCQHCAIKTTARPGIYDDFFLKMVSRKQEPMRAL
jgi:radical SAM protein with 4Fe4S-binding SPASM domain